MPVKLGSKLPPTEARIEIIPLIDIMFFLLAAFMLVSLSMVHLKAVKVNLPASNTATADNQNHLVGLTVNRAGLAYLDAQPVGEHELAQILSARLHDDAELRVMISGDADARHGDMMRILDIVRAAGIQKVAFVDAPPAKPMNRAFALLNLLGVLVLTALCVLQWRANRALNLDVNRLEQTRQSQAARLAEEASQIAGLTADLDRFRDQLTATMVAEKKDVEKQLSRQRDQIATSIADWTAALAARDQGITEANERIRELSAQLKDTVTKYNALVATHNTLVRQMNEKRAAEAEKPAARADSTQKP